MSSFVQSLALGELQHTPLLYLLLFAAVFVHEGAAIALGAMLLVQHQSSPVLTAACLIGGVIAGDFSVYGLGVLGRRNDWVQGRIGGKTRASAWFESHLVASVALCRLVPGLLYPTFFSFGWYALPFRRFAPTTIAVSAAYVAALLTVLVQFGKRLSLPPLNSVSVVVVVIAIGVLALVARFLRIRYPHVSPREAT